MSKICLDEIVEIKKVGFEETIDITVSGDSLFFANDILTHNSGATSSDVELSDTSESWGLPQTVDFMFAMMRDEQLDARKQVMIKQLKSRFNDVNYFKRFVIGLDISKFKFYDVDQSAQNEVVDAGRTDEDVPMFDKSLSNFDQLKFD